MKDAAAANGVRIEATLRARKRRRGVCSGCGKAGPTYDHLNERRFDFVPLWGIAVVLVYGLRRIPGQLPQRGDRTVAGQDLDQHQHQHQHQP